MKINHSNGNYISITIYLKQRIQICTKLLINKEVLFNSMVVTFTSVPKMSLVLWKPNQNIKFQKTLKTT